MMLAANATCSRDRPSMTTDVQVGIVVNPISGMGGRVGLHGTDGPALAAALAVGATHVAGRRASRALRRLAELAPSLSVVAAAGSMGADLLPPGWSVEVVGTPTPSTTAADTRRAVAAMVDRGAGLIVFAGGDGTARDVVAATGSSVPVLGIPCGVKMHSAVFATGPEAAGTAAAQFVKHPELLQLAEVVDFDVGGTRVFALASVPRATGALQAGKAGGPPATADLIGLGRAVAADMQPGRLYLLGPGTTVATVSEALGVPASLVGVDAVIDGELVAADAGEQELLTLLAHHPIAALVLGVVGGQGFLFGRGNQQLSSAVLRAVGADNIEILAAAGKVAALEPPVLRIDLDDRAVAQQLTGHRRVRTSRRHSTVMRVVA